MSFSSRVHFVGGIEVGLRESEQGTDIGIHEASGGVATRLARIESDPSPLNGPDALSLVARLTRESWTLAGRAFPRYSREQCAA